MCSVTGSHVADRPANFLPDGLTRVIEKHGEGFKNVAVDGCLGKLIFCRQNIAKSSQRRHGNNDFVVLEQLTKAWDNIAFEENKNTLIATLVSDVR